ncbi:hypothetical protein Cpin_3345 [Chitinophaga pinensis DSM 2588]|uniref:Uncharacterized protein n=1 Tax=Chitinophaga pinensis (strain ATCC 43595 / DSM 2588 / LMG 13176 / NBRC 15968 / NCIMB 11800 / UQM 2034) TaxID=485918 RepID=A0A979G538_CHIPD|nr:hypothetical protein Cpin_3345 [Chitinophaga pinensis DSM 2588]
MCCVYILTPCYSCSVHSLTICNSFITLFFYSFAIHSLSPLFICNSLLLLVHSILSYSAANPLFASILPYSTYLSIIRCFLMFLHGSPDLSPIPLFTCYSFSSVYTSLPTFVYVCSGFVHAVPSPTPVFTFATLPLSLYFTTYPLYPSISTSFMPFVFYCCIHLLFILFPHHSTVNPLFPPTSSPIPSS